MPKLSNAKLQIYSAVLKETKPFKAAAIHQSTQLSRSLIQYHLEKLIDGGYLEKDGMFYCLVARNDLLDALTDVSSSSHTGLLDKEADSKYLKPINTNRRVEDSVILRNAKMPGAAKIQAKVNSEIDGAISSLKALRRFHNGKTISESKALDWIEQNLSLLWERIGQEVLDAGVTRAEFEKRVEENML